jgi:Holliday junction resolvase RusA-like endonuclease
MNWTTDQLAQKGYQLNQDGSYSPNTKRLLNTLAKHAPQQTLESLREGEETCRQRTNLRITRYSCRPLDCDNYAGGCKPALDQLRYAKLIRDDSPEDIEVDFRQVKVKTKKEERTEIEISETR